MAPHRRLQCGRQAPRKCSGATRRVAGLPLGWPRRVLRSTAARHPGGAARLISLRHPWRRSNRRPLAGGQLPHAMTALKFGARFLSITQFHRSGGAGLRSRRRSRPLRAVPPRGSGGHPSVVAGWRDRDVRASRRRSARSQGRRRAVKQKCPSVPRAQHSSALPVALPRLRRADVASTTPPAPRQGGVAGLLAGRRRVNAKSALATA